MARSSGSGRRPITSLPVTMRRRNDIVVLPLLSRSTAPSTLPLRAGESVCSREVSARSVDEPWSVGMLLRIKAILRLPDRKRHARPSSSFAWLSLWK